VPKDIKIEDFGGESDIRLQDLKTVPIKPLETKPGDKTTTPILTPKAILPPPVRKNKKDSL
jgi:hypothetical protein